MTTLIIMLLVGLISLFIGYLAGRRSAIYAFATILRERISDSDRVVAEIQASFENDEAEDW